MVVASRLFRRSARLPCLGHLEPPYIAISTWKHLVHSGITHRLRTLLARESAILIAPRESVNRIEFIVQQSNRRTLLGLCHRSDERGQASLFRTPRLGIGFSHRRSRARTHRKNPNTWLPVPGAGLALARSNRGREQGRALGHHDRTTNEKHRAWSPPRPFRFPENYRHEFTDLAFEAITRILRPPRVVVGAALWAVAFPK